MKGEVLRWVRLRWPRSVRRTGLRRVRGWVARYGPAEIVGLVAALDGSVLAHALTGSDVAAAYGAAAGEALGFYAVIVLRDVITDARLARASRWPYGWRGAMLTLRDVAVEFGPAELLDLLIIRPLCVGVGIRALGIRWGVIAGKLAADCLFYLIAILGYERRTRQLAPRP